VDAAEIIPTRHNLNKLMLQRVIYFDKIELQIIEFGTYYARFFQRLGAPTNVLSTVLFYQLLLERNYMLTSTIFLATHFYHL
jgi:hypothetical protein